MTFHSTFRTSPCIQLLSSLFIILALTRSASAQGSAHSGREFYVCFDKNYRSDDRIDAPPESDLFLSLTLSSETDAHVSLSVPFQKFETSVDLKAHKSVNVTVPSSCVIDKEGIRKQGAVHILASQPINVVGMNHRFQTSDSYAAIPVDGVGTDYRLASFAKLSSDLIGEASIVATRNNTDVEFTPTQPCVGGLASGVTTHVTLQAGDVYHVVADGVGSGTADLSGSKVHANYPISVFSGHSGAYIPTGVQSCNLLIEQLQPMSQWGSIFYVSPLPGRKHYSLKVVAGMDRTEVHYGWGDGEVKRVLNDGEVLDISSITGSMRVRCSAPVQVMQYSHGHKDGDDVGDPSMIQLRPREKFVRDVTLLIPSTADAALASFPVGTNSSVPVRPVSTSTPLGVEWQHYAVVTLPSSSLQTLRLNGEKVDLTSFGSLDAEMSVGRIMLKETDSGATLHCDEPMSVLQYGLQSFDCYGHGW